MSTPAPFPAAALGTIPDLHGAMLLPRGNVSGTWNGGYDDLYKVISSPDINTFKIVCLQGYDGTCDPTNPGRPGTSWMRGQGRFVALSPSHNFAEVHFDNGHVVNGSFDANFTKGNWSDGSKWTYVLPSRIPSLCTRSMRAGIEWCRCHRAVCMARPR